MEKIRDDITVLNELDEVINLNEFSFRQTNKFMIGFVSQELISQLKQKKMELSLAFLNESKEVFSTVNKLANGDIETNKLEKIKYNAWSIHDKYDVDSKERAYMRVVVCTLYDEESSEIDQYGAETIFETFVSCLFDLGGKYCYLFRDYFLENLPKISQQ